MSPIMNTVRAGLAAGVLGMATWGAQAHGMLERDFVVQESPADVAATTRALVATIEGAGATVFAVIDHGAGAASVGQGLNDAQLVIFGNPALGTQVMQDDLLAGLALPLKILVYEGDDGITRLAHEDPSAFLGGYNVSPEAPYMETMRAALMRLGAAALDAVQP
jgi:uncharacterized protein (DUF302 family)